MTLIMNSAIRLIGIAVIGVVVMNILTKKEIQDKLGKYDCALGIIIICLGLIAVVLSFHFIQVGLFKWIS